MFKLQKSRTGSALLTVLLLVSFIALLCLQSARMATIFFDTALKKQSYEQQKNVMYGIMEWAVQLSKTHFESLYDYNGMHQPGLHVEIPSWNIYNAVYNTHIYFENIKKHTPQLAMAIKVSFHNNNKLASKVQCHIIQKHKDDDTTLYKVNSWSLDVY